MQELLINIGAILLICSPTAAVIAFGIKKGYYTRAFEYPAYPDKAELDRREYQTMLRHRRRAKLEKQFASTGKR